MAANNYVTLDTNYGGQSQTSNAIALNLSARPRNGLAPGRLQHERTRRRLLRIRAAMPELTVVHRPADAQPDQSVLRHNTGWITRYTALGSYTIPKIDVLVAGTLRSDQGGTARGQLGGAELGHRAVPRPAACRTTRRSATVNLITPGTLYGDRVNEIDLRARQDPPLRPHADQRRRRPLQRVQQRAGADLQPDVRAATATSAGSWLPPTSVLQSRFVKFSAQIDF